MPIPASYRAILREYNSRTDNVQWYFEELPKLLNGGFPSEVSLAYLFLRAERAHNRALYCGVVKLHSADRELADCAVQTHHLPRDGFLQLFQAVFGQPLKSTVAKIIKPAESVRDRVIHGKTLSEKDMREAHLHVLDYATQFNQQLSTIAGFEPFGDLRGFKGRGTPLGKPTTRWLLKGLGFSIA